MYFESHDDDDRGLICIDDAIDGLIGHEGLIKIVLTAVCIERRGCDALASLLENLMLKGQVYIAVLFIPQKIANISSNFILCVFWRQSTKGQSSKIMGRMNHAPSTYMDSNKCHGLVLFDNVKIIYFDS